MIQDAAWHRERAARSNGAAHGRLPRIAAWLEGAAQGYRFRAREMAYDACGGMK